MTSLALRFGDLLKQLRKRAGMTQGDLAAAVGYSVSSISALEQNQRLPTIEFVLQSLLPALAVGDEPPLARRLVELAAAARGERPPVAITVQRTAQIVIQEEAVDSPSRLPSLPTVLIGRTAQVNQLCDRLLGHGGRLLTLVGPPGIGKTTLALAVGAQVQPHYRDGAVFVALAAITEPDLMASTIATAVGCSDTSPKPPQVRLIEFLRRKTMLLILDNLEQLTGAAGLIAALIAECPGICVLATSRERLHLRAEQRFKVPPLNLAPAVELFVQRAQAVDADFRLTPHNQPTLAAICQRLDCLPLALELCAAQIDLFSPAQLLAQLQARPLDLLVDGAQDLPPQHRTLRAAIQRSYALLNAEEQRLLRMLGGFVGGFALPEVAVVVDETVEIGKWRPDNEVISQVLITNLHALIGKSLMHSETTVTGEQRFILFETIREFALEQLQANGEEAWLRQRHFAAYLQFCRIGDSHLRRAEGATWATRLELEQDNVRAALEWAFNERRYEDVAWLVMVVGWFWHMRGNWVESGKWGARLLPHRQLLSAELHLLVLTGAYIDSRVIEEFQPPERWTQEMIQMAALCSVKAIQAVTWLFLAAFTADFSQAAPLWERAIAVARAACDEADTSFYYGASADPEFMLSACVDDYAMTLIERGEIARAVPFVQEGLAINRRLGNQYEVADSLGTLGLLALLQGDLAQAHTRIDETVTMVRSFKHQEMQVIWQSLLGIVTLYQGHRAVARTLLLESLTLGIELKEKGLLARVCTFLIDLTLSEGDTQQAEQWLRQSIAYFTDPSRITLYEVMRLWVAARLATAQQQYQRAATLLGLADQMHRQLHYAIAGPMRELADAALATVQGALGTEDFDQAFAEGQRLSLEKAFATILIPTSISRND